MITLTDAIARTLDSNTLGRAAKAFVSTMTDEQAGDWYRSIIGSASSEKAKRSEPASPSTPNRKPAAAPKVDKAKGDPKKSSELEGAVLAFVAKNPGSNAIQIGAACGGDYRTALASLVAAGKLRKEGRNRGTKYTAIAQ